MCVCVCVCVCEGDREGESKERMQMTSASHKNNYSVATLLFPKFEHFKCIAIIQISLWCAFFSFLQFHLYIQKYSLRLFLTIIPYKRSHPKRKSKLPLDEMGLDLSLHQTARYTDYLSQLFYLAPKLCKPSKASKYVKRSNQSHTSWNIHPSCPANCS